MDFVQLEDRISELERQNRHLASALGALLLLGCLLLGVWNLYQTQSITRYSEIYEQMLDGTELPALTTFMMRSTPALFAAAAALPVAALAVFLSVGRRPVGLALLLGILLLTGLQIFLTRTGLWLPLYQIITGMSSA